LQLQLQLLLLMLLLLLLLILLLLLLIRHQYLPANQNIDTLFRRIYGDQIRMFLATVFFVFHVGLCLTRDRC
jgi:amino acid permease